MSELKRYSMVMSATGGGGTPVYLCSDVDTEIAKLKGLMLKAANDLEIEHGYHHRVAKTLREVAQENDDD